MTTFLPALLMSLSVLLSVQDPLSDANGDGSLVPPTAAVYRSPDTLDATTLDLEDSSTVAFAVGFASLGNPHNLPNGFSLPIVEVYLQDEARAGGSNALLPGSGMRLADGEAWTYAFQLNGDRVRVFEAADGGVNDITLAAAPSLTVDGATLRLSSRVATPDSLELYAVVGNYAPFSQTGWRGLSREPSPWSYSSSSQQYPVVDVLAPTVAAQQAALRRGVLPPVGAARAAARPNMWVALMLLGLVTALAGLVVRVLGRDQQAARPLRQKKAQTRAAAQPARVEAGRPGTGQGETGRMVTGIPAIDWDAPELNQNINDLVARRKTRYVASPLQQRAAAQPEAANPKAAQPEAEPDPQPLVTRVPGSLTSGAEIGAKKAGESTDRPAEAPAPETGANPSREPKTDTALVEDSVVKAANPEGVGAQAQQTATGLLDFRPAGSGAKVSKRFDGSLDANQPADSEPLSETVETIHLRANRVKTFEAKEPPLAGAPIEVYSLKDPQGAPDVSVKATEPAADVAKTDS